MTDFIKISKDILEGVVEYFDTNKCLKTDNLPENFLERIKDTLNIDKSWYNSIEDAMNDFDFKDIHDYMESVHWTWYFRENSPSINELRESAFYLLYHCQDAYDGSYFYCESGGFRAEINECGKFRLSFNKKR